MTTENMPPAGEPDSAVRQRQDKRDRIIMDKERVWSAIAEAGYVPSRVSSAEHLKNTLATGRVSRSSEATSRAFEAARSDTRL